MLARAGVDGLLTSDDLGAQKSLMFSPATFREFLKPWFAAVIAACHEHGLHFWLHCCGQVTEIMEDFCEIGLDVLHPIQAGCMNHRRRRAAPRGRAALWAQALLPGGRPLAWGATEIMEDFCEMGLDVLHPIQAGVHGPPQAAHRPARSRSAMGPGTLAWGATSRLGGHGQECPCSSVDVQYLLPGGTVAQVRQGIEQMVDVFDRPEGGLVLGAGNAISCETPLENIEAYLDTITNYGRAVRRKHAA